jgi:hypothetical protein
MELQYEKCKCRYAVVLETVVVAPSELTKLSDGLPFTNHDFIPYIKLASKKIFVWRVSVLGSPLKEFRKPY